MYVAEWFVWIKLNFNTKISILILEQTLGYILAWIRR